MTLKDESNSSGNYAVSYKVLRWAGILIQSLPHWGYEKEKIIDETDMVVM